MLVTLTCAFYFFVYGNGSFHFNAFLRDTLPAHNSIAIE